MKQNVDLFNDVRKHLTQKNTVILLYYQMKSMYTVYFNKNSLAKINIIEEEMNRLTDFSKHLEDENKELRNSLNQQITINRDLSTQHQVLIIRKN